MAFVDDWFGRFQVFLYKTLDRDDLSPEPEYWAPWPPAFRRDGITEEVAGEAVRRVAAGPPFFKNELLHLVRRHASEVFRERVAAGVAGAGAGDSREAALAASKDCDDCGGTSGLAHRYRHSGPRPGETVVLYCLCHFGRWVERNHRDGAADVRRRMNDLADHPEAQLGPVPWSGEPDNRFCYPPSCWDGALGRPAPARTFAELRAGVPAAAAIGAMPEPAY